MPDMVIVGAGFAGLYMLVKSRELGLTARVLEAAPEVGGTWYHNRYPGARCDIESMQYSYGFSEELQQEWDWKERYAGQPEILAYAKHVADRFDLRRDITFNTRVTAAAWDEADRTWSVDTDGGERIVCRYLVMATGNLSTLKHPDIPGQGDFAGDVYHTADWPHEPVDFTGKRVGIVGTGSSAVQAVPVIAEQARHLTVFQRTANFVMPSRNRPLTKEERDRVKADYRGQRQRMRLASAGYTVPDPPQRGAMQATPDERRIAYEARWAFGGFSIFYAFNDTLLNAESNEAASDFVRSKLREVVKDPVVADKLTPHISIGCKRLCIDTGYWEAFNRDNVSLVDVSESPIERIMTHGVRVAGHEYQFDALIYATGFDAITGTLNRIAIRGRDGLLLKDKWAAEGPRTYLGVGVAGFPNLFLITGPGSPGVLTSVITAIEHHVEFVADALTHLRDHEHATIEPTPEAESAWVDRVGTVAQSSLRAACHSWFLSPEIPGGKRIFMPYAAKFPVYAQEVADIVANGYEGFTLR